MKKQLEILDFGFSDDEFSGTTVKNLPTNDSKKAQKLYDTIVVFLDNLSSNPEKDTIHWPNRVEKINLFKKKLEKILNEEC